MPSSFGDEGVCPSSPKKEGVMTMATLLLSFVESCGGAHDISSREEEVCLSSPEKERVMIMVTFLDSSVGSSQGGHGLCHHLLEKRRSALPVPRRGG